MCRGNPYRSASTRKAEGKVCIFFFVSGRDLFGPHQYLKAISRWTKNNIKCSNRKIWLVCQRLPLCHMAAKHHQYSAIADEDTSPLPTCICIACVLDTLQQYCGVASTRYSTLFMVCRRLPLACSVHLQNPL